MFLPYVGKLHIFVECVALPLPSEWVMSSLLVLQIDQHDVMSMQQLKQACPAAHGLVSRLLLKDPVKRMTAAQALQDTFCQMK